MKNYLLLIACLLQILIPTSAFAANVTKVVITAVEPMVGERQIQSLNHGFNFSQVIAMSVGWKAAPDPSISSQ